MKKSLKIAALLILLVSCQKEVTTPPSRETIMLDNKPVLSFTEPYYQLDYVDRPSLLIKQVNSLNRATVTITDMSRKIVYLTFVLNTVNYNLISSSAPILPPTVEGGSWAKCMLTCIRLAGAFHFCQNDFITGCMLGYSVYCLWNNYTRSTVYPKITKIYLGPIIQ